VRIDPTRYELALYANRNDEGWETVFLEWLKVSRVSDRDAILVFSVGGGDAEHRISVNLVHALEEAKNRKVKVFGVVGRRGGFTKEVGDVVVVIPTVSEKHITPHTEAFQAVVWHCLVSHPKLQKVGTKWESATRATVV